MEGHCVCVGIQDAPWLECYEADDRGLIEHSRNIAILVKAPPQYLVRLIGITEGYLWFKEGFEISMLIQTYLTSPLIGIMTARCRTEWL